MIYTHNYDCPFEAYITNLGKYNEGELIGEWVKFPVTDEEIFKVFKRIGIGSTDEFGQIYEEWFITDYDIYVDGLTPSCFGYNCGEFASLDSLNNLANALNNVDDVDTKKIYAILEYEGGCDSIEDIIECIEDIENYYFYEDISCEYDLGYFWINEVEGFDLDSMGVIGRHIDYEGVGIEIGMDGIFTSYGYIER